MGYRIFLRRGGGGGGGGGWQGGGIEECLYDSTYLRTINLNHLKMKAICSIKGLSFGSKDYTKELKTVKCTRFLGQTS